MKNIIAREINDLSLYLLYENILKK